MAGCLLAPLPLLAAAGDLDCTFGDGGTLDIDLSPVSTYDAVQQNDGKIVAMGSSAGSLRLSRFLPDGDLDPTFGAGGSTTFALADAFAVALAVDSLGRFVVAGEITRAGDSEVWVARFTSAGAADASFGGGDGWTSFDWTAASAAAGIDSGDAIAIDSSDRPIVGGWTDANATGSRMAVARLTTSGALDPTFGSGGIAFASSPGSGEDDTLSSLKVDSDGRVVAIGSTTFALPLQFPQNTILARWTVGGTLDATFDGDGVRILDMTGAGGSDRGADLDFDSMGRILALGSGSLGLVGRLTASGALDTSFDGDGLVQQTFIGTTNQVTSILAQADDKPLVVGWPRVGSLFDLASMRFTTSGGLDTSWGSTGVVTTTIGAADVARAAFLKPDQRLVIVGSSDGHLIMARYLNDASIISTTTTTITSDLPDPSMAGTDVSVGVSVSTDSGLLPPIGTVAVGDGVDTCSLILTPAGGATASGSCTLTLSTVGTRTLTASYQSDVSLCSSGDTEPHQVTPASGAATTTEIIGDAPDPSVVGQVVTISYSVLSASPGSPSGSVFVSDGVDSCIGTVATGSCDIVLSTVGARSLTASYGGDGSFGGSVSRFEAHQVDAAATSTSILLDLPDVSVTGQPVTVVYSVGVRPPGLGKPTGTVTVTDGVDTCTATVADGSCSLSLSTTGARSLIATYAGDGSFSGSVSIAEPHQVDPAATTTSIASDTPDPSSIGQPVTVAYSVTVDPPGSGTPTGTVTVTDGVDTCTATVADGSCSLALSTPGARSLSATYAGEGSFSGSVSTAELHQVDPAPTTTSVVSHTPDPSVFGQAVTVVYSVTSTAPGTASGEVTVTDGIDACTGTVAAGSCALALSTVGLRSLTATYPGDSLFGPSSDTVDHTVEEAPTATMVLSLTPNPATVDSQVTVAFSVEALPPGQGFPTGEVIVDDGSGNGCSAPVGEAGCSFVAPAAGRFTITAAYSGDGSYGPSQAVADELLEVQGLPVVEVPTLGEFGLVLLGLLLAAAAISFLRRIQDRSQVNQL
ncbi:MAG: IPTL-CTERM sorting domain-containing protein [Acidobacteriota bacterium]